MVRATCKTCGEKYFWIRRHKCAVREARAQIVRNTMREWARVMASGDIPDDPYPELAIGWQPTGMKVRSEVKTREVRGPQPMSERVRCLCTLRESCSVCDRTDDFIPQRRSENAILFDTTPTWSPADVSSPTSSSSDYHGGGGDFSGGGASGDWSSSSDCGSGGGDSGGSGGCD